jgi:hypothetical protein
VNFAALYIIVQGLQSQGFFFLSISPFYRILGFTLGYTVDDILNTLLFLEQVLNYKSAPGKVLAAPLSHELIDSGRNRSR